MQHHITAIVLALGGVSLAGNGIELTWYSIGSGGTLRTQGGVFELSGSIGRSDVGAMNGGVFDVSGGFLQELPPAECSSVVLDHVSFTQCFGGPDSPLAEGCDCFDIDRTGAVDLRDFAVSQNIYQGR